MNVLVLNGSPKGSKSNTFKLTTAFLQGFNEQAMHDINIVDISKSDIKHCTGCFCCWTKTPSKCVIKDDMADIIDKYINADLVIWSFPLYFFSMPSVVKSCMDRLLPIMLPYMKQFEDGTCGHPLRYELQHQKHLLITTSGFYSRKNNFEGLLEQFRILYERNGGYDKIICTEGELFSVNALKKRTSEYLSLVSQAGREYSINLQISQDTQNGLEQLLYEPDKFCQMADASWDIAEQSNGFKQNQDSKALRLVKQMAGAYVAKEYKKDIILEICFTDVGETYQLHIKRNECLLVTENFSEYTTKILTSLNLWLDISSGKENAKDALYAHKFSVFGDFSTMYRLDYMFGIANEIVFSRNRKHLPNLLLFLFPYIAMWVAAPFGNFIGSVATICAIAVSTCAYLFVKNTVYEKISIIGFLAIVVLAEFNVPNTVILVFPYFMFGAIWLITVFIKIPITAIYMLGFYGGEGMLQDKLYLRTNRIITLIWAIYYIIAGVVACFSTSLGLGYLLGAVLNAPVILLGIFTIVFARMYVSAYAKK